MAHLLTIAGSRSDTVIGLDFSFGFPEWWARAQDAANGPDMWRVTAGRGEGWLEACAPPFWGRAGCRRPPPAGPAYRRLSLSLSAAPVNDCDALDRVEGRVFDPRLHTVRPG